MSPEKFDADYFLRGTETGKSNYTDYTWKASLTIPMAMVFVNKIMGGKHGSVLEVGCARGYFVKALRFLEIPAVGYDISRWAIENCHPDVKEFVSTDMPKGIFDWAYGKDLLEHLTMEELKDLLGVLVNKILDGMFFIVPVCAEEGGKYVYPNDEKDPTHVQRHTLDGWIRLFLHLLPPEFAVYGSYHIEGLKPASKDFPFSCGFFMIKRHEKISPVALKGTIGRTPDV